jgi:hypothetical protein
MAIQGWRWAKTIFTWIFLLGTAGVHFGKALLATVDQASNLYAIGEHLEKARKMGTGTVNIGSLLLFLFGAAGATIITLWIWHRGPFRGHVAARPMAVPNEPALTQGAAPAAERKPVQVGMIPVVSDWTSRQPLVVAGSVESQERKLPPLAIGVLRSVIMEPGRGGGGGDFNFIKATVRVDFSGDSSCIPSPSELLLTTAVDDAVICRLTAARGTEWKCPGSIEYVGEEFRSDVLGKQIEETMGLDPTRTQATCHRLAELRICLPDGQAGRDYYASMARLAFHQFGKEHHAFTLKFKTRGWYRLDERVEIPL